MQITTKKIIIISTLLLGLGFLLGRSSGVGPGAEHSMDSHDLQASAEPDVWTCSMHPQVRLPDPGKCPICSMDLIKADSGSGASEDLGPRTLQMSASAVALADIATAPVERRSVAHEVRMVGKIAFDETRLAYITSWVSGRLDRLYVDYTGVTVRADDHLAEIYSPTLYSAQQELLQAIATAKKLADSNLDLLRETSNLTVISSREKLSLYGLSDEQIDEIVKNGKPDKHITMLAPIGGVVVHKNALEGMYVKEGSRIYTIADLSKVWVLFDAYESDLAWLRYGQDVEFRVEAYPGEAFHGRIAFIDPLLDDRTRTVKIRLNVDNSDGRLKPEMFVSATAQAVLTAHGKVVDEGLAGKWMCPMHPEVIADSEQDCPECGMNLVAATELGFTAETMDDKSLVIPSTAPLITGKRAVVYVKLENQERPTFEGREIALGPRAGNWYVVHEGLKEGELVVVKGNFKIDSELQIRARPSMMSPEGGVPPAGHNHGGGMPGAGAREGMQMSEQPLSFSAPEDFRQQMGALVDAYIALQQALASDQLGNVEARGLLDALGGIDMALLDGDAHMGWMEVQPMLTSSAADVAAAGSIDKRRDLLSPLTEGLVWALRAFGYTRTNGEVGIFRCPMAVDGEPANWLQEGAETINPYMGSSMLGCGSFTESIAQEN